MLSSYLQGQDNDIQVDLPEATREECIAAFALFDRNKSGQITKEEIGELLKAAGQFPTEEDIEDLVEQLDADGSGGLNLAEFLEVVSANPKGRDLSAELIEAFKILDEDADGQRPSDGEDVKLRTGANTAKRTG
ncbi:unnamed protein product [Effrenium voratum]|nr:unnamed protein product [Effrenium voratum]